MNQHLRFYALISLASTWLIWASPAQSQPSSPCSNNNQEQPSSNRREITNDEYGLRFQVPANYRAELQRGSQNPTKILILLRNPADVEFLECARRSVLRGAGHQVSDVIVTIEPLRPNIRGARDLLREAQSAPGIERETFDSNFVTIAGQEAVIYTQQSIYPYRSRIAAFIHPDQQHIVTVFAGDYGREINPIDLEVMQLIISSLTIEF